MKNPMKLLLFGELIKVLELSRCLVTIDAMGTQTQIAGLIKDKGADYCLALKGNHKYLHQRVVKLFERAETQDWSGVEPDFHRTITKDHGRTEIRRYWTMSVRELFFDPDQWVGLQSIGLVESVRKIGSETTTSKLYYLNSFASNAPLLAHAGRSHWGIENNLHWVGDRAGIQFRLASADLHSAGLRCWIQRG